MVIIPNCCVLGKSSSSGVALVCPGRSHRPSKPKYTDRKVHAENEVVDVGVAHFLKYFRSHVANMARTSCRSEPCFQQGSVNEKTPFASGAFSFVLCGQLKRCNHRFSFGLSCMASLTNVQPSPACSMYAANITRRHPLLEPVVLSPLNRRISIRASSAASRYRLGALISFCVGRTTKWPSVKP